MNSCMSFIERVRGGLSVLCLFFFMLVGQVNAQSPKFDYIFQEAMRQKLANHHDVAIDLLDYCRQLNPESGVVLYELSELYRYAKNDTLAIQSLQEACRLYPDNYWYKDRLVTYYLSNRREAEALQAVEEMSLRFPEKSGVLMLLLQLYEQKSDFANMVKVLDKIEVKEGKSEQLSMEKFRLFLQMKDEKRAFEEMRNLANEFPNDLRYQVVIGDLYLDADKREEALKQFKMVEAKDSSNVALLMSMANYYHMTGDTDRYQQYMTKMLTNENVDDATRVRMMTVLVHENLNSGADSTQLLTLFDKVLKQPQTTTDFLELRVRYMVTKKMEANAVKPYLREILKVDPENNMARQQLLAYAIEENDTTGIVDICKPAVDYHSSDPVFYYYLGVSYFQQEEKQKAVEVFRKGLTHVEESDHANKLQLRVNMYALMGDIYHGLGRDEEAFQAYDSCLVYKQDDAMVLNNYAYYLSLRKKDLDRAEQMSKRANELEPDNSIYLDTYAWVLFQQKRYAEAKVQMDRVLELMERDGEELDGDVREHVKQINKKVKK
ncbi:MAG: tetratricopeptide repeat protein [Bacteroidales bacterium]|nr:tetratricopeptide repeat protein [Bacteroidales bacterium]